MGEAKAKGYYGGSQDDLSGWDYMRSLCLYFQYLSARQIDLNAPGTFYWHLMSLMYGPSYSKGYSISENALVVIDDSILRVILAIRNIL